MTGKLHVAVPDLPDELSLEADVLAGEDLAYQTRLHVGETVDLEPGTYVVAVTMPDGTRRTATRSVKDGGRASVKFEWSPPPFAKLATRAGARSAHGQAPEWMGIRFVGFEGGAMQLLDIAPRADVEATHSGDGVLQVAMDIVLQDDADRLRFAQLGIDGRVPVLVALPLAPHTDAHTCRLSVAVTDRDIDPAVRLGGDTSAAIVADYVAGGMPERITAIADLGRTMLLEKRQHPLAAALGAYALLRLGETERMRNWPANLARWYEWLPDGEVITGELLLRRGDVAEALDRFVEAVRRGPPVFTDGLSILTARLRSLVKRQEHADRAAEALDKVLEWASYADLSSLCLSVTGADIADLSRSQQAVHPEAGVDGWTLFREPFGVADNPDDYWDRG